MFNMLKMRNLIIGLSLALMGMACAGGGRKAEVSKTAVPAVNLDSVAMAETVHAFYKWYGESGEQLITRINFVNTAGKNPTLDLAVLAKYLGEFSKSGAICTEFIQNETIFYRACALAWANENSDEGMTGFDIDRYYCQQDGEVREFQTAGITSQITGDRATVQLMLDPKGPNGGPRNFEMKKENGKWLLSKNGCEEVLH